MPAAIAILVSGIFDGLDGAVARATHTTSQFGVNTIHSPTWWPLAWLQGCWAYLWALQPFGRLGWVVAFLIVACGALRLARFNVYVPTRAKTISRPAHTRSSRHGGHHGLSVPSSGPERAHPVGGVLVMVFLLSFPHGQQFQIFQPEKSGTSQKQPFNTLVAVVLLLALAAVRPQIGFVRLFRLLCGVRPGADRTPA